MTLKDVRGEFCEKVVRGFERLNTAVLCTDGKPMFVHRTGGEMEYLE